MYPPRSQWRRRCSLRACPVLSAENDRPQTRPAVHSSRQPADRPGDELATGFVRGLPAAVPASAMGDDYHDPVR